MPALTSPIAWRAADGCDGVERAEMFARRPARIGAGPIVLTVSQTVMRNGPCIEVVAANSLPQSTHQQAARRDWPLWRAGRRADLRLAPRPERILACAQAPYLAHDVVAPHQNREWRQQMVQLRPQGMRGRRSGSGMDRERAVFGHLCDMLVLSE